MFKIDYCPSIDVAMYRGWFCRRLEEARMNLVLYPIGSHAHEEWRSSND